MMSIDEALCLLFTLLSQLILLFMSTKTSGSSSDVSRISYDSDVSYQPRDIDTFSWEWSDDYSVDFVGVSDLIA